MQRVISFSDPLTSLVWLTGLLYILHCDLLPYTAVVLATSHLLFVLYCSVVLETRRKILENDVNNEKNLIAKKLQQLQDLDQMLGKLQYQTGEAGKLLSKMKALYFGQARHDSTRWKLLSVVAVVASAMIPMRLICMAVLLIVFTGRFRTKGGVVADFIDRLPGYVEHNVVTHSKNTKKGDRRTEVNLSRIINGEMNIQLRQERMGKKQHTSTL